MNHLTDQVDAASVETAAFVRAAAAADAAERTVTATLPQTQQLIEKLVAAGTSCPHLAEVPIQPAFVFLHEGRMRCRVCMETKREKIKPGQKGKCDTCSRYVGRRLTSVIVRMGYVIVALVACETCRVIFTSEGQVPERRTT